MPTISTYYPNPREHDVSLCVEKGWVPASELFPEGRTYAGEMPGFCAKVATRAYLDGAPTFHPDLGVFIAAEQDPEGGLWLLPFAEKRRVATVPQEVSDELWAKLFTLYEKTAGLVPPQAGV